MSFDSTKLLGLLIVALIIVGGLLYFQLYTEIRGIRGQLDEINREISDSSLQAQEALEDVNAKIESVVAKLEELEEASSINSEELALISESLEEARTAIEELRETSASLSDIESLSRELALIRASLDELANRVEGNTEALEELKALQERVEELSLMIDELAELILYPAVITDATGDSVIIPSKPQRIVSMAPSVTEVLYYVNALDRLVGVDDYSDWPQWVADARENGEIESIGGFWTPNVEKILALEPDLVIGVASAPPHVQVKEILKAYGIPVILLPSESLDDVKEALIIAGRAVGNLVDAYTAAVEFEASVAAAKTLIGAADGVKVAVIVWLEPLFVVGWGNWENDIITSLGAVNVFGDESDSSLKGWPIVSVESLYERAPDVIILLGEHVASSPEDFVSWLESQLGEAAFDIPAVANNRVYLLSGAYSDVYARPSPRTALSVYIISLILTPENYGLSLEELPSILSPETLDVIQLISDRLPENLVEFLGEALS